MTDSREFTSEASMEFILEFIKGYIKEHSYPPTVREIADGTGFKSTSTVHMYLQRMLTNGMLETDIKDGTGARALRVPGYEFRQKQEGRKETWKEKHTGCGS